MMNVESSVEKLLLQFFEQEKTHSTKIFYENVEAWCKINEKYINGFKKFTDQLSTNPPSPKSDTSKILKKEILIVDGEFETSLRMSKSTFKDLEREIKHHSNITDENLENDLSLSLYVLGSTHTIAKIGRIFKKEESEVLDACVKCFPLIVDLSSKYVVWPSHSEMLEIESDFFKQYKFPGVMGIIGSIHIGVYIDENITNGSEYFNETAGNHTVVLQAVCDNNLLFRDIFVGYPGSHSVEYILKQSPLYERIMDDNPFFYQRHLLGGTMHPQLQTLLTPYKSNVNEHLTKRELTFNNLHSEVMCTIEKTFQLVEKRFPRIMCLDVASPKFVTMAIGAICTLHNFTRMRGDNFCL